jgi:uncharacterized protein (TIRG00374 family)
MRNPRREPAGRGRPAKRAASFLLRHGVVAWLSLVAVLAAVVFVRQRAELGQIAEALRTADPRWVAVGIGIEIATLLAIGLTYHLLLRRLGYRLSCLTLASVHLQRAAVSTLSPVSGPTSVCVFVRLLTRERVPTQDGFLIVALRSIAGQGALALTLAVALALQGPSPVLIVAAGAVAAAILLAGLRRPVVSFKPIRPVWLRRLPRGVVRWIVEFRRRFRHHRLAPRDLAWPLALAVAMRAGAVVLLFASLRAFGVEASAGTVSTVYVAALVARVTVPVFGGAGVVEAATAMALTQTGLPGDLAIGVALLWRLIDFWLPLVVGLTVHAATLARPPAPRRPRPPATGATRVPKGLGWQPVPVAQVRPEPARAPLDRRRTSDGWGA